VVGQFKNRVALVTGGSSGIGRASALAFAKEGAMVAIADLAVEGGKETESIIRESGGTAIFTEVDVSKASEVEAMIDTVVGTYGRLDYAHNNAGILGKLAPTAECTEENWENVINTNLKGVWLCMKYEIPKMRGGAIVNTSSVFGLKGGLNLPAYIASKHGVIGATKAAAAEYVHRGIRINAVCPDAIRTPMQERLMGVPFGRPPEEVAQAVVWLCSDASSATTGETLTYRQWTRRIAESQQKI
jgi:NAD(P)-dependent dehydrogenase (short-subunit alcohol dehydrogenase family)